jgi:hypothetical protein
MREGPQMPVLCVPDDRKPVNGIHRTEDETRLLERFRSILKEG